MAGTRKMSPWELNAALDYLMHSASESIEGTYEETLKTDDPQELVKKLRSVANLCSRIANHIEDL